MRARLARAHAAGHATDRPATDSCAHRAIPTLDSARSAAASTGLVCRRRYPTCESSAGDHPARLRSLDTVRVARAHPAEWTALETRTRCAEDHTPQRPVQSRTEPQR